LRTAPRMGLGAALVLKLVVGSRPPNNRRSIQAASK
jgi:hypothetical protein